MDPGNNLRLLKSLSHCSKVSQPPRRHTAANRDRKTQPCPSRQRRKRRDHRSIELLKQSEKPVRRQTSQQSLVLRRGQSLRRFQRRFKNVPAKENKECTRLQQRRQTQKLLPRQHQRGHTLNSKDAAEHKQPSQC